MSWRIPHITKRMSEFRSCQMSWTHLDALKRVNEDNWFTVWVCLCRRTYGYLLSQPLQETSRWTLKGALSQLLTMSLSCKGISVNLKQSPELHIPLRCVRHRLETVRGDSALRGRADCGCVVSYRVQQFKGWRYLSNSMWFCTSSLQRVIAPPW